MSEALAILDLSPPGALPRGLRFATVYSPALGRRADLTFHATPGAAEGSPLAVLLHGVGGSHWCWAMHGRAHEVLDELVERGAVRPMLLAMPSDGLRRLGSGYVAHAGEDAETWVHAEVPAIARALHDGAGDGATCVGGLSMGGWGALRLAARHPGAYTAAAGLSSVTSVEELRRFAASDLPDTVTGPSLAQLLTASPGTLPPLMIDCGRSDELLEANRALHAALLEAGVEHRYRERDGGHDWDYWSAALADMLLFFEAALAARDG